MRYQGQLVQGMPEVVSLFVLSTALTFVTTSSSDAAVARVSVD